MAVNTQRGGPDPPPGDLFADARSRMADLVETYRHLIEPYDAQSKMSSQTLRKGFFVLFVIAVVAGMGVIPAVASNTVVNHSADSTQSPDLDGDVTVSTLDMGWDSAPSQIPYEDDSGEQVEFLGDINQSVNNTYEFTVTHANVSDFNAFPHDKAEVSALDAGEWSGTGTASDVEVAGGVDAVELDFGASEDLSFSNFSVTSDEEKRYLQIGLDATTVNSGTILEFQVVDVDSSYAIASTGGGLSIRWANLNDTGSNV